MNLGVRYDLEYGSFNQNMDLAMFPKPLPFINPSTRGDHNNVQPRLGFAWDLNKSGESVMRGSYGIYNGTVRNGSFGTELANLLQSNITIRNPSYPDPYGGKDPLTFASTAPPNITIVNDDIVQLVRADDQPRLLAAARAQPRDPGRRRLYEGQRQHGVLQHQHAGSGDRAAAAAGVGPHRAGQSDRRDEVSRALRAARQAVRQPRAIHGRVHAGQGGGQPDRDQLLQPRRATGGRPTPTGATRWWSADR